MKLRIYFLSMLSLSFIMNASAQFDDLYYDPYKDGEINTSANVEENNDNYGNGYDDQSYAYYDEYNDDEYYEEYDDYEYSSRVRKFRRPAFSMGYYSPIWGYSYRDYIYDTYDPFYNPYWYGGNSVVIVVGNPGWGWNRWNRWNSWNNWGCGYNSWNNWGWNSWDGNNYYVNNYYGNGWGNGWNNGWGNGWGNNGGWNHNNNNNNNNSPYGNYYGSRKSGSSIASTEGRKDGPRRSVTTTPPTDRNPIAKDALTQADQKDMNPGSSGRSESTRTRRTDFNDKPHKSSIYDRRAPETSTKPDNGGVRQSERKDGYSRENNNKRSERRSENIERERQSPRSGNEPNSSRTPSRNENRSYESPRSSSSSSSRSSGGSYNGGSSGRSSSSGSGGGSSSGRSGSSRRG